MYACFTGTCTTMDQRFKRNVFEFLSTVRYIFMTCAFAIVGDQTYTSSMGQSLTLTCTTFVLKADVLHENCCKVVIASNFYHVLADCFVGSE